MIINNLRKWLPLYRYAKQSIDLSIKQGKSWYEAFSKMDAILWAGFEGVINFGYYFDCSKDYDIVLKAATHYLNVQYKKEVS